MSKISENKKEKVKQTKSLLTNYIYVVAGASAYLIGLLIFTYFPIDIALLLFMIFEASEILALKLLTIWFGKPDNKLWNEAVGEYQDAKTEPLTFSEKPKEEIKSG